MDPQLPGIIRSPVENEPVGLSLVGYREEPSQQESAIRGARHQLLRQEDRHTGVD